MGGKPRPALTARGKRKGGVVLNAIYARQSVDKADSLSIQGQVELCEKQLTGEVRVYQDRGYSGKNTNRPAFLRMMSDVEQGRIQKIVVYRLDRFSRSIADFGRLWDVLKQHGVEFVSVNETFDTSTPMGRAMLNIIMVFAQLERETTAERVRDNYYQRVRLGAWPGGPAPYGFSIGRLPGNDGRQLPALVPSEHAPVVERIFRAYAQPEASLGSVARALNAEGVPAPRRTVWDSTALSRLLHNPLYVMADEEVYLYCKAKGMHISNPPEEFDGFHAGMLIGKRERSAGGYQAATAQQLSLANHFGLIPSGLWLQCQYKLDENRQLGRTGCGKHTWLSGLMKCAHCGYSVKVIRNREKYYLVCSGRSNLGLCDRSIRGDLRALEASVAAELERLLAECSDIGAAPENDSQLSSALADIDRKLARLMDALTESTDISMTYINRALERLERQRRELLERQRSQCPPPRSSLRRLRFEPLSFEQKKLVAARFIREIRLSGDAAEVFWNV